jgi:hypothetical protein
MKWIDKKLLWTILIILFLIIFIYFLREVFYPDSFERKVIYAKLIVSDHTGVEINDSALAFGAVMPGGSSIKKIVFDNSGNSDVKIELYSEGDLSDFLKVSDNYFILVGKGSKEVKFVVKAPLEAEYGVYEGNVIVRSRVI